MHIVIAYSLSDFVIDSLNSWIESLIHGLCFDEDILLCLLMIFKCGLWSDRKTEKIQNSKQLSIIQESKIKN